MPLPSHAITKNRQNCSIPFLTFSLYISQSSLTFDLLSQWPDENTSLEIHTLPTKRNYHWTFQAAVLNNFKGHPEFFFLQFSQNIDGFKRNVHKAFRIHKILFKQNSFEDFFYFHHLPKLYIGFKQVTGIGVCVCVCVCVCV